MFATKFSEFTSTSWTGNDDPLAEDFRRANRIIRGIIGAGAPEQGPTRNLVKQVRDVRDRVSAASSGSGRGRSASAASSACSCNTPASTGNSAFTINEPSASYEQVSRRLACWLASRAISSTSRTRRNFRTSVSTWCAVPCKATDSRISSVPGQAIEPMRAGLGDAVRPALAPIEFGDEIEPAIICGVQVSSQFGDLRFEFAQWKTRFAAQRSTVHDALHVPVYMCHRLSKTT